MMFGHWCRFLWFLVNYGYRRSLGMGTPKLAVLRASLGNDHFQHVVLSWYGRFVFVRRAIITITISRWGVLPLFYSYGSIELSTGGWDAFGGGGWLDFVLICCGFNCLFILFWPYRHIAHFRTCFPSISSARSRKVSQQLALFLWSWDTWEPQLFKPSCPRVSG